MENLQFALVLSAFDKISPFVCSVQTRADSHYGDTVN